MLVVEEEWVVLLQEPVEMAAVVLEKMEFVTVMVQQEHLTLEAVVEDLQVEFLVELVVDQE
jgi:protein-arginine kinase